MSDQTAFQRRTFLKGLGTTMALPLLESLVPSTAFAANAPVAPVRLGFIFFPCGAVPETWKPSKFGSNYKLSESLKPLAKHQADFNVFANLSQYHGRSNGDGAGDHARASGSFLTGAHLNKTSGADIKVGISADQAAAKIIGKQTKLPSIELGIDRGRSAGRCDSGYSCAYSSSVSWKSATTPMAKEINPRLAFERLFGSTSEIANAKSRALRKTHRQSVLDLVAEDAAYLRTKLGKTDRRKIDEYFSSVREIELRIARASTKKQDVPAYQTPAGIPRNFEKHVRLMYDIMALAFQTDTTRVASFMIGNGGSNRRYTNLNISNGHHGITHHGGDKKRIENLKKIDKYLASQFGYFLDKLKSIQEGEGTLLDNSLILYGSGIMDANRHSHHDLPILLAGSGGGAIKTGQHIKTAKKTPLNNLFLTMLNTAGAKTKQLGDSTGMLKEI